jgi:hypothetical protein
LLPKGAERPAAAIARSLLTESGERRSSGKRTHGLKLGNTGFVGNRRDDSDQDSNNFHINSYREYSGLAPSLSKVMIRRTDRSHRPRRLPTQVGMACCWG